MCQHLVLLRTYAIIVCFAYLLHAFQLQRKSSGRQHPIFQSCLIAVIVFSSVSLSLSVKSNSCFLKGSDGSHKLPLLFIRKAANPRCFKHLLYQQSTIFKRVLGQIQTEIFPSLPLQTNSEGVFNYKRLDSEGSLLLVNAPTHPDDSQFVSSDKAMLFLQIQHH